MPSTVKVAKLPSPPQEAGALGPPYDGGLLGKLHPLSGSEKVVCVVPVDPAQEIPTSLAKPEPSKANPSILSASQAFVTRDAARVPTNVWLVLDRCDGGALHNFITDVYERGAFFEHSAPTGITEATAVYVVHEILQTLDFLHRKSQAHGFVSAQSVFVTGSGNIKLVSPSLAKFVATTTKVSVNEAWVAPELQRMGRGVARPSADIWGLGLIAIHLINGSLPVEEQGDQRFQTTKLMAWKRTASDSFRDFVDACLTFNAQDRPSTKQLLAHRVFRSVNHRVCKEEIKGFIGFAAITDNRRVPRASSDMALLQRAESASPTREPPLMEEDASPATRATRTPDNLVTMSVLDERSIVYALQQRYSRDKIYTHVGEMLIAINPLKAVPIYGPQAAQTFGFDVPPNNSPHIFGVAQAAFKGLRHTKRDQVCLITGESGAGKTENSKYFLSHLLGAESRSVQLILKSTPLLESFGNARTVHNNNSSRFGKYLEILYDTKLNVVGARLSKYLLEQSRVVAQAPGETTFHVFEYLMAGASASLKADLYLDDPRGYAYMGQTTHRRVSKVPSNPNIKRPVSTLSELGSTGHGQMYESLIDDLLDLGFDRGEISGIHVILAVVLNVGNVDFVVEEGNTELEAVVFDPDPVSKVADLLGVDDEDMTEALVSNVIETAGETFVRRNTVTKAVDTRDAMAKALYGRLFSWIVNKINEQLGPTDFHHTLHKIGVLDIFGFECMAENSLEQLFINIANEELQHYFNQFIFAWEIDEYKREGVTHENIVFTNNQAQLDLLLGHPIGILSLLVEESRFPRGTDASYVAKLREHLSSQPLFQPAQNTHALQFTVTHYAAKITYKADGFLEKNRDTLSSTVVSLLRQSSVDLVQLLFDANASITATGSFRQSVVGTPTGTGVNANQFSFFRKSMKRSRRRTRRNTRKNKVTAVPSIASTFKASLRELMNRVQQCTPHFVRCIKPNHSQLPNHFELEPVSQQLRYAGVMEATRIRQLGYPGRHTYEEFLSLYQVVAFPLSKKVPATKETCEHILRKAELESARYGHSKVFLKFGQVNRLGAIVDMHHASACTIQRAVRCWSAQRKLAYLRWEHQQRLERQRRMEEERKKREAEERKKREEDERKQREEAERMLLAELHQSRALASSRPSDARISISAPAASEAIAAASPASASSSPKKKASPDKEKKRSPPKPKPAPPVVELQPTMPKHGVTNCASDSEFRKLLNARRHEAEQVTSKLSSVHPDLAAGTHPELQPQGLERAAQACGPLKRALFMAMDTLIVTEESLIVGARDLNRYRNILPTVSTRILLKEPMSLEEIGAPPDHASNGNTPRHVLEQNRKHYVNANRVRGFDKDSSWYIAAQGPSAKTVSAFWRLIWEQDVPAIVMVTGLVERGKEKCFRYWPTALYNPDEDVGQLVFGDITVYVLHGFRQHDYIVSELLIRRGNKVKQLSHFWFVGWPDHGVPERPEGVLKLRHAVYNRIGQTSRPVLVHCSAGVGRTGTFIAIDMGVRQLLAYGQTDALKVIGQMREDRGAAVQTDEQYALIYNALLSFALDVSTVPGTSLYVGPDAGVALEEDYDESDSDYEDSDDDDDDDDEVNEAVDVFQYYAVLSRKASKARQSTRRSSRTSGLASAGVDSVAKTGSIKRRPSNSARVTDESRQKLASLVMQELNTPIAEEEDDEESYADAAAASMAAAAETVKLEPRQKTGAPLTERQLQRRAEAEKVRAVERAAILTAIEEIEHEVEGLKSANGSPSKANKSQSLTSTGSDFDFSAVVDQLKFLKDQITHREIDLQYFLKQRQALLDRGTAFLDRQRASGAMSAGERELKQRQLDKAAHYDEAEFKRWSLHHMPSIGKLQDKVIEPNTSITGTFVVKEVDEDEAGSPPPFVDRAVKPQPKPKRLQEVLAERQQHSGQRDSFLLDIERDEPPSPFQEQAPDDTFLLRRNVDRGGSGFSAAMAEEADDTFDEPRRALRHESVDASSIPSKWEPFDSNWLINSDYYSHKVPKRTQNGTSVWGTMQYFEQGKELTRFAIAVPEVVFSSRRLGSQAFHFSVGLLPNRSKDNRIVNTRKGIGDGLSFTLDESGNVWMVNTSKKPVHDQDRFEAVPIDRPQMLFDVDVIRTQVKQLVRSGASKKQLKAALSLTVRTFYFGHEDTRVLKRGHAPRVQMVFKFEAAAIEVLRAFACAKKPVLKVTLPVVEEIGEPSTIKRKFPKGSVSNLIPLAL